MLSALKQQLAAEEAKQKIIGQPFIDLTFERCKWCFTQIKRVLR